MDVLQHRTIVHAIHAGVIEVALVIGKQGLDNIRLGRDGRAALPCRLLQVAGIHHSFADVVQRLAATAKQPLWKAERNQALALPSRYANASLATHEVVHGARPFAKIDPLLFHRRGVALADVLDRAKRRGR